MSEKIYFDDIVEGTRFIYRMKSSNRVAEDTLIERSPSGDFVKFEVMGWASRRDLSNYEILEVLGKATSLEDEMCPNCVTPWKCNGPHKLKKCRSAPGGSPQLERYLDALELARFNRED